MSGYSIPTAVRTAIETMLENGTTTPARIAGQLHRYEFATAAEHRLNIITEVIEDYYETHPEKQYTTTTTTPTDDAIDNACSASPLLDSP